MNCRTALTVFSLMLSGTARVTLKMDPEKQADKKTDTQYECAIAEVRKLF